MDNHYHLLTVTDFTYFFQFLHFYFCVLVLLYWLRLTVTTLKCDFDC